MALGWFKELAYNLDGDPLKSLTLVRASDSL
jgi:hypothetical protein